MKKKLKLILPIIIILITIVGVGSLLAYLTSKDHKSNIFTLGRVKIELNEANWDQTLATNLKPNDSIAKDPTIKNIGRNQAYVYIKVITPIVELMNNTEGPLFTYTTNSGWTQLDQVEQCDYQITTYYYNTELSPNSPTTSLFDEVTLANFGPNVETIQDMVIYGYAIQTNYLQNGTTIPTIFTSHFSNNTSGTSLDCTKATDCSNNEMYATAPSSLKGLAKSIAKDACLDNGKSKYVSSCNGVDFSNISSDTNGKGIYEIASTKNDTYPIYYYRGDVDNNNVKFAGFCWKAIRTTDTGGVKMIYNGTPNSETGGCTNTTGESTQIGISQYGISSSSLADVGYMYGTRYEYRASRYTSTPSYVYGGNVTWDGTNYTLTDTKISGGRWNLDYDSLNNHHYTCFSESNTCDRVLYIFGTSNEIVSYLTLTNGKKIEDALDEMLSNSDINGTDSPAKSAIDTWYSTNLSSYTNLIEDTIYCNDRIIKSLGGFNPNGGVTVGSERGLHFNGNYRITSSYEPILSCSRNIDKYTVDSTIGNGALTYPVGLITSDEAMYAGGKSLTTNENYYLYTNKSYWTMSPDYYEAATAVTYVSNAGSFANGYSVLKQFGLRPVISLSSNAIISSGDGSTTNPYTVQTN